MQIRLGYELVYDCPQPTPMLLVLNVHYTRISDMVEPTTSSPAHRSRSVPTATALVIGATGSWRRRTNTTVCQRDRERRRRGGCGRHRGTSARCGGSAGRRLGIPPGQPIARPSGFPRSLVAIRSDAARLGRVQADLRLRSPAHCLRLRTRARKQDGLGALRSNRRLQGLCPPAVAFCRCMNIPARYCTGYLGDIGVPVSDAPMDFAAWLKPMSGRVVHLDARNNIPHRPRADRPRPRCGGRRDQHDLRPEHAQQLYGTDRGSRCCTMTPALPVRRRLR